MTAYAKSDILTVEVSGNATLDLTGDLSSDSMEVLKHSHGALHFVWSSLDAFNATAILQGSNDNTNWNDLGGADGGVTLLEATDSQVWEFTTFTTRYIRLSYQANDVTTGTGSATLVLKR